MVDKVERSGKKKKTWVDPKTVIDFDPSELTELENVFSSIDKNGDGSIDRTELLHAFNCLGYRDMTEDDIKTIIKDVDLNSNAKIEYNEFIILMRKFKKSGLTEKFKTIVNKKGEKVFRMGGEDSYSQFSEEERSAFVRLINTVLAKDPDCEKLLPINPDSMDVFSILKNGVILCKLINIAVPGTIDERVINRKDNMNVFLCTENLKLALAASKSIGCKVIGISYQTILDQKYTLILGIIWQIIKMIVLAEVNLKAHPEIIRLLNDNEELSDLLNMPPEEILKRWFNYHLGKAGYEKKLSNFSGDIKDSEKYTILLNQLDSTKCDKVALQETDLIKRGQKVLENAKKLGASTYITPHDITTGNQKLNLMFTADIFNNCHGLEDLTEKEAYEAAKLLDDDVEGTREERAFRMWINSLGLDDVHVNNLYEDVRSGVLLLKVIDKIKPGVVNWKKVNTNTTNKFKKVVNCNEAVDSSKKLGCSIVGIGGPDLHEPNKKLVLAIVWQLMKMNTLQILGNKSENDLLKWGNGISNWETPINSFGDKRIKNSIFFIDIMAAIEPRAIDWDLIKKGIALYFIMFDYFR